MAQPSPIPTNHDTPISSSLNVSLADSAALSLIANTTANPVTTAAVFEHGSIITKTNDATGVASLYVNTGTSATPVWNPVTLSGINGANLPSVPLFLLDNGVANTVVVTAYTVGTTFVPLSTGLIVAIRLKSTLQAGANTINFNGTTKSLKKHTANNNITTTYAAGGVLHAIYTPGQFGGVWQSLSDN